MAAAVVRLMLLTALIILALWLNGVQLYEQSRTDAIIADLGFASSLQGFATVMVGLFLAAVGAGLFTLIGMMLVWSVNMYLNTIQPKMPILNPALAMGLAGTIMAIFSQTAPAATPLVVVSIVVAALAAIGCALVVKVFRLSRWDGSMLALVMAISSLVVVALPFFVQFFAPGTNAEKLWAFLFSPLAVMAFVGTMMYFGAAKGKSTRRLLTTLLTSCGSTSVAYAFVTNSGLDDTLPQQLAPNTIFNFILISLTLLTALVASGQTFFAMQAAAYLLRRRTAAVSGGKA